MPTSKEDLPSTVARSGAKVRRTYGAALDSAHDQYPGDEERAHQTAWSAVKQVAEKVGDHWEVKPEPGASDEGGRHGGETHGGIDTTKTKVALYDDATEAGIRGRSKMTKAELVAALERHSRRATARARE